VFSAGSMPRCYKQDRLAVAVRKVQFSRCELLLLEADNLGRGHVGNPEEGERLPLQAATKRRQ
jgi:hypothetical protein